MSRFIEGDGDEDFPNAQALWWRAQENALRGRKGQAVLRELEAALVALPEKRLIEGALCDDRGQVCALGALATKRGLDQEEMKEHQGEHAGFIADWAKDALGLSGALATAIEWENDEGFWRVYTEMDGYRATGGRETAEQRYERVLAWVRSQIAHEATA